MSRAQGWLARAAEIAVTAVALAAFIVLLIFVRGRTGPLPAGAQLPTEPAARLAAAAALLEVSTAAGRPGYTFEIVQRSTITARPGGPKIEIPDPTDRSKSLGLADTYDVGALIERGAVTPDGFWMEMRTGPAAGKDPDWTSAYQFGAISKGGATFRNDGVGWYATDNPPGIGLDPRTAALLPRLLRSATEATDGSARPVTGPSTAAVRAKAAVKDIPGVIASDGAPFTELVEPVDFAFDDQGRLIHLRVVARNTNLDVYDLLVDTTITFAYPATAAALPEPVPARPASADVVSK